MKKSILVLTDLTIRAEHAAFYAMKLAQKLEVNVLLCNIFLVPVPTGLGTEIIWQNEHYEQLEEDSINDLDELGGRLVSRLKGETLPGDFIPDVEHISKAGLVGDCINEVCRDKKILLAVISSHGGSALDTFFAGNHARQIIENAGYPILMVPDHIRFDGFKKIAFASCLDDSEIAALKCLTGLARLMNADLLVTHVTDEQKVAGEDSGKVNTYLNKIATQIDYDKIYYQAVNNKSTYAGLEWLAQHKEIDMMVLVHRKRSVFQKLVSGSITQKLAANIPKPMLIFQKQLLHENLPVFQ
jgi:nucleotide-binding universal stress UspA family protein